MQQRRLEISDIHAFLRAVGEELPRPCEVVVIGPTALMLGDCPEQRTSEMLIWRTSDSVLFTAADRACERLVRPVRVFQPLAGEPHHAFEDRLQPVKISGLKQLTVLVPERHDLAPLMAAQGDKLDGVAALHRNNPLNLETLIQRYHEMKREVSWPRARFKESFVRLIAKLFGPEKAAAVEKKL